MTGMCIAAANYLIERTNDYNHADGRTFLDEIPMTCKRLQKLLYFSEIVYMKRHGGTPMLKDKFYAWPSGPVIPSVYYQFQDFQGGYMEPIKCNNPELKDEEREALSFVFNETVDLDTLDLVNISHIEDGPWAKVYDPNDSNYESVVEKEEIYRFYQNIEESKLFLIP